MVPGGREGKKVTGRKKNEEGCNICPPSPGGRKAGLILGREREMRWGRMSGKTVTSKSAQLALRGGRVVMDGFV